MTVIIRNLDDDAAVIFIVDSNLRRKNILPSERTAVEEIVAVRRTHRRFDTFNHVRAEKTDKKV